LWGVIALLGFLIYLSYWAIKRDHRILGMATIGTLLIIVGYSTFLVIKIRSGLNPFLDENDPESWKALLAYLNREQYGTESLFLSMFKRRAPFWSYQINKMYLRYLSWNFFEPTKFYGIPLFIGLIGLIQQFLRDTKNGIAVLALFFMTGLAIILYVNQEDPQPRERDYSYVGSFYAFAIWIGIGSMTLMETVIQAVPKLRLSPQWAAVGTLLFLIFIAPANMLAKNYHKQDRTGNYVAWDYSYNLLMTCEPNAILYTNGDNDTFPLWYLQVVENVRPDVRVVNLSLLNTGWFIKQIRDKEPKVPMTTKITDSYVDNVIDSRDFSGLRDRVWTATRRVRVEGPPGTSPMEWEVPAPLSFPTGSQTLYFLRVQDFMILNTIANGAAEGWSRPFYFAVTVSDENLLGLRNVREPHKNFLAMEGMAFKLHPQPTGLIDPVRLAYNMFKVYKYRNLDNPSVYYDDNIIRLLGNYRQALIQLAFHWSQEADATGNLDTTGITLPLDERIENFDPLPPKVKSLTALEFMDVKIPEEQIPMRYEMLTLHIARLYSDLKRPDLARKKLDLYLKNQILNPQKAIDFGALYLSDANAPDKAQELFTKALKEELTLENLYRVAFFWQQNRQDMNWVEEFYRLFVENTLPVDTQSTIRAANQLSALGLNDLAIEVFETILRSQPYNRNVLGGLVNACQNKGDYPKALDYLNEYLRVYPSDSAMIKRREQIVALIGRKEL
ncbi:MAG: tetratricopeptide repeat protein, partial [bacterium]